MSKLLAEKFPDSPTSEAGYALAMLVAAEAVDSREFSVTASSNEVTFDYSYHSYPQDLGYSIFKEDISELPAAHRYLIIAIRAGLVAGAPRVDFECWSGNTGFRYRVQSDTLKDETLSKAPWKDGRSRCRVVVRFRTGLSRRLYMVSGREATPEIRETLSKRVRYAGQPVLYNDSKLNQTFDLGKGLLEVILSDQEGSTPRVPTVVCEAEQKKERDNSGGYYGHFLYGGDGEGVTLVSRGLEFSVDLPLAEELGFSGLIISERLNFDREYEELLEDTLLDDLLNDVESDLLNVAADLVDVLDVLDEEGVDQALDVLEIVMENLRSSGDTDEALVILKKLVDVEKLSDEVRASYLTQMALTHEREGESEESFDYYVRALEYWGLIPHDEQDHALVASALLGAARLMDYHDSEPEVSMQYARNALDLRRSVGEEDDLEKGEAAELLARLYVKHHRYPQPEFLEVESLLEIALELFGKIFGQNHNRVADVLTALGRFHQEQGALEEAEAHYLRALAIKEKLFGSRDDSVGELFDLLGALFEYGGQIQKAGQYYSRALEVREHLVEPDDPEIAKRLNDLVVLYRVYGHYGKAEPLLLRLIGVQEDGGDESSVEASGLCSLALFYQVQSKFQKAEELFKRALKRVEDQGDDSETRTERAWIHGLFGRFYDQQYLFKKAKEHLIKGLEMTEEVLGPDHPDLIIHLDALANHYRFQQKYAEAMPWAERSLAITERFYGMQHPYLATALNSYAELLYHSDQKEMAVSVYLAGYEIRVNSQESVASTPEVPDPENSHLAIIRAQAEELQQKASHSAREYASFADAEALYLRALFIREQNLGPDHPDNARTLVLLAELYRNHRRYEGAESLYRRSLDLRRKSLGEGHPDCGLSLSELTEVLMLQKEYEAAKPLLEEWLAIVERTLGPDHPERAEILVRTGQVLESLGDLEQARELLGQAVAIRHTQFGTEHPTFAATLAELLRIEDKPARAAELYDFVVTSLEKNMDDDDPLLIPIYENYAKVLVAVDDAEKAARFETRAMVMRVEYGLDFGSAE